HGPVGIISIDLGEHLKKRVLKHVFREFGVPQIAAQVAVKLTLVAAQKHPKGLAVTAPKVGQQFFVRAFGQIVGGDHKASAPSTRSGGNRFASTDGSGRSPFVEEAPESSWNSPSFAFFLRRLCFFCFGRLVGFALFPFSEDGLVAFSEMLG